VKVKNIAVGDLIVVSYEASVKSWGNYWIGHNRGIPAGIPGTRISEVDDDMRIAYIPSGTTLPVLDIRTIEEEGCSSFKEFLVLDRSGQLLWVEDSFSEKHQPTSKENSSDVTV
jgi:hypothetical protein